MYADKAYLYKDLEILFTFCVDINNQAGDICYIGYNNVMLVYCMYVCE